MARVPEQLRGHPAYPELRKLMREGVCVAVALRCEELRASPRIQGLLTSRAADTTEAEAKALVDVLLKETSSVKLTSIMSAESLRLLFPEGDDPPSLSNRREGILDSGEFDSDTTLTRRELTVCIALLAALGFSFPDDRHGKEPAAADSRLKGLDGEWFAIWETTVHGAENYNMEVVQADLVGTKLAIRNTAPSPHNPEGYLWQGALEAVQQRILVGSYSAVQSETGWSGTLYYQLGGNATFMDGRWVGANIDSTMNSGLCVLARSEDVARNRFKFLVGGSAPIPRIDDV
jgi:hypothetical protein